jgi:fucose permease
MCIALVMPTCLALAGERIQGNPGALFGGLLTLAQIGGMVLPAAIGFVAQYTSVRLGLALLVGSYGAIAVLVRRLSEPGFRPSTKAE